MTGGIVLVRHGETEWNRERRFQGRSDSPLTERGIAQARAVGRLLAALEEFSGARVVASPLGRAQRTAEIICEQLGVAANFSLDDRLREHSLGLWDGFTYAQIAARCPGIFNGDGRHEWYFRAPGGETYAALAARVGEWLQEQQDAAPTVAVTHGLVSRVLRGLYVKLERAVALTLPVPQDRVFHLFGGRIVQMPIPAHGQSAAGRGYTS